METLYYSIYGITIFANSLLGVFIYLRNPQNKVNQRYTLLTLAIVTWIISLFLIYFITDPNMILFTIRYNHIVGLLIPFCFYRFAFAFPKETFRIPKVIEYSVIGLTALVCALLTFTPLVIKSVSINGFNRIDTFGDLYPLFILAFLLNVIVSIYILVKKYKQSEGIIHIQLQYIIIGSSITFLAGLLTNILLPYYFDNINFDQIGPIWTLIFLGNITYSIIKHRFLDMRLILARSITYISLIGILGFFYILDTFLISRYYIQSPLTALQIVTYAVFALFIAFTFQPIKTELEQVTENIFFKNKYNSHELLHSLTEIMASTIDLEGLLRNTLRKLTTAMHIARGSFIIFKDEEIYSIVSEGYEGMPTFNKEHIKNLLVYKRLIVFDEEQEGETKDIMRALNISIFKPLIKDRNKIGVLLLGEKKSGEIYEKQDFDLLEIFVPGVIVAIENAKSYEEIKRFNITLRDGIDKATKDLQNANDRLRELDKMKDEFVSLASHELRTPLTAIKSYLSLLVDSSQRNPLSDEQKIYADRASISTDRLINLVNDMLNVSRIDSGRINIVLEPVKLNELIQEVVDEVGPRAKELGLTITINNTPCPFILADKEKIKEVFLNIIGNSLKFTPKDGTITISFAQSGNMLETQVADTGVGIESQDLPKLFQKFGYIQSAYEAVHSNFPGTGLGLYMCKSLVEQQKGRITASSPGRNQGAIFTVVFPILSEEETQKLGSDQSQKKTDPLGLIHYQI